MAIKANITVDQGADFSTSVELTTDDLDVVDLTGYSASAQIRKTYSSTNAVSFGITMNEDIGMLLLSLSASQTANMTPGRYVYDVTVTSSSPTVVSRIVEGIVTVTPRVTQ